MTEEEQKANRIQKKWLDKIEMRLVMKDQLNYIRNINNVYQKDPK